MAENPKKPQEGMKVIVAMDGSEQADKAFNCKLTNNEKVDKAFNDYMSNIHQSRDEVILLHCVHHSPQFLLGTWKPVNPEVLAEAIKAEDDKGKEICQNMETLLEEMQAGAGSVSAMRIDGDPGPSIVDKARELGASLIVIGSRGRGTIRRTILGSVSDYIIHHAHVPVLVCPPSSS